MTSALVTGINILWVLSLNSRKYDYYFEIVTIYQNLPNCNILVFLLWITWAIFCTLYLAPSTATVFSWKWTDMGVYKLWRQPHLSWGNDIMLMFLLHCIFHHGYSILFYFIPFHSILFYSILFHSKPFHYKLSYTLLFRGDSFFFVRLPFSWLCCYLSQPRFENAVTLSSQRMIAECLKKIGTTIYNFTKLRMCVS